MGQNRKITFILTTISAIIGVMLAVQLQSNLHPKQSESRSITELRKVLLQEQEKSKVLLADISKQEQLLSQYQESLDSVDSIGVMKEELSRAQKQAGLASVSGKGIIIRIEQDPILNEQWNAENLPLPDPSNLVLDVDLRWLTNELLANGAQVLSINNNRLLSNSSIRNVGEEIQVDTKTIRMPYEIKALGNPDTLISSMKLEGLEEFFRSVNMKVTLEERENLLIPAFNGTKHIQHMKPVKAKGDS